MTANYFTFSADRPALESFVPVLQMNPERPGHYMHHTHLSNLTPIETIFAIAALFLILYIYFLPTITAIRRNSPHKTAVIILNTFFGVTLLGWIFALVLASKQPQPAVIIYNVPPRH